MTGGVAVRLRPRSATKKKRKPPPTIPSVSRGSPSERSARGERRSAQEIFDRLRAARRPVGIASVYRPLETLADLRLIKRVEAGDGVARFKPAGRDGNHHHHLVCRDCGKVEAFADPRLERAIHRIVGGLGYEVDEHEVLLTGACSDCAA
jgi:Fur family ferric uptake transcriptional regulator